MQTETGEMPDHRDGIVIESTRAYAIRTGVLLAALVAAGLMISAGADVPAARPDPAAGAGGDKAEAVAPSANVERSGSLAAYPLLY